MKLKVIIQDVEGGFWAMVPGLPDCTTEAGTYEELLHNLNEALERCLGGDEINPIEHHVLSS
jgi:predicted RNase H-like HicB family nuclease